ncbi:MAG: hypothetical protein BWK78_08375 [Thiotrichaceae bacterium IS1]|nr:MAG: hypothetical protein BWK78_08375 [Thiotrichaceae bacterium IS1]
MITRELVKSEIDLVEERYLETLRNIIQQFQQLPAAMLSVSVRSPTNQAHHLERLDLASRSPTYAGSD